MFNLLFSPLYAFLPDPVAGFLAVAVTLWVVSVVLQLIAFIWDLLPFT